MRHYEQKLTLSCRRCHARLACLSSGRLSRIGCFEQLRQFPIRHSCEKVLLRDVLASLTDSLFDEWPKPFDVPFDPFILSCVLPNGKQIGPRMRQSVAGYQSSGSTSITFTLASRRVHICPPHRQFVCAAMTANRELMKALCDVESARMDLLRDLKAAKVERAAVFAKLSLPQAGYIASVSRRNEFMFLLKRLATIVRASLSLWTP